jgi:hypothetical protein
VEERGRPDRTQRHQQWSGPAGLADEPDFGLSSVWPTASAPDKAWWPFVCVGGAVMLIAVFAGAIAGSVRQRDDATVSASASAVIPARAQTRTTPTAALSSTAAIAVAAATAVAANPPTPAAVMQTVTYSCKGYAPNGIDITYGPEGSTFSAASLPFVETVPLETSAQNFVTEAQLEGGGSVSCDTMVDYTDSSGALQSVSDSVTASGGYSNVSAQVCSDFNGGWKDC